MAGVNAVEPQSAIDRLLSLSGNVLTAGEHQIPLTPEGRIVVVGGGKAGAPMAAAVEAILGPRVSDGLVCVKYDHLMPTETVTIREADHPVPDTNGLNAAHEIAGLLTGMTGRDLVICLISGGGSALLPLPAPPVTLEDKQAVTDLLLRSGADIMEINCIRKHLSLLKGGGLARFAHPARVLTLILSDGVGDPLDVIASGPTVADPTTYNNAMEIIEKYGLREKAPLAVIQRICNGIEGTVPETLKPGSRELDNVSNLLVGTNSIALDSAALKAGELGYSTTLLSADITGETRTAADVHASMVPEILKSRPSDAPPVCLLSGGETTVTIRGPGKGGRNQEFALAAAIKIDGLTDVVILSGGTDGTDGPTDAAGAISDGTTVARAIAAEMDSAAYLDANDSYHFFEALGDLLITGPTLTNVMDLRVVLVG